MSSTSSNVARAAELVELFRGSAQPSWLEESMRSACAQLPRARWTVLALGKASAVMAKAACAVVDVAQGLVVAPTPSNSLPPLKTIVSSHPVPDHRSEAAGRALLRMAEEATGPVLALISGGGSALACVPAPGMSLGDKVAATQAVMRAGARIADLNTVRKALSAIKGGRLAAACPSSMTTLACSDVVGDEIDSISSGPTVLDSTPPDRAAAICRELGIWAGLPAAVRARLDAPMRVTRHDLAREPPSTAHIVAPLAQVAKTASKLADARGYRVELRRDAIDGDVAGVAKELEGIIGGTPAGVLWIGYGEATIELGQGSGVGGRAQQLALLMARELAGARVTFLCAGTDGIDGNSRAAGAVIDGRTWQDLQSRGVDPQRALDGHDAYPALASVGATIETGPTGVNHADLLMFYVEPPSRLC